MKPEDLKVGSRLIRKAAVDGKNIYMEVLEVEEKTHTRPIYYVSSSGYREGSHWYDFDTISFYYDLIVTIEGFEL